jgi:hypothetical protein
MSDQWRDVVRHRNRAEMLRTIAEETEHDEHRLSLRKIAAYYDKLATALERQTKTATA